MPLAHRIGVVSLLLQHLREEPVGKRDGAVISREAAGTLGDAGQAVGMVVAAGEHAGARW